MRSVEGKYVGVYAPFFFFSFFVTVLDHQLCDKIMSFHGMVLNFCKEHLRLIFASLLFSLTT